MLVCGGRGRGVSLEGGNPLPPSVGDRNVPPPVWEYRVCECVGEYPEHMGAKDCAPDRVLLNLNRNHNRNR